MESRDPADWVQPSWTVDDHTIERLARAGLAAAERHLNAWAVWHEWTLDASMVELLMWWRQLDETLSRADVGAWKSACDRADAGETGSFWGDLRPGLIWARNQGVHGATRFGTALGILWEDTLLFHDTLLIEEPRNTHLWAAQERLILPTRGTREWRDLQVSSYAEHLDGQPTEEARERLRKVFQAAIGTLEQPMWRPARSTNPG